MSIIFKVGKVSFHQRKTVQKQISQEFELFENRKFRVRFCVVLFQCSNHNEKGEITINKIKMNNQ